MIGPGKLLIAVFSRIYIGKGKNEEIYAEIKKWKEKRRVYYGQ